MYCSNLCYQHNNLFLYHDFSYFLLSSNGSTIQWLILCYIIGSFLSELVYSVLLVDLAEFITLLPKSGPSSQVSVTITRTRAPHSQESLRKKK